MTKQEMCEFVSKLNQEVYLHDLWKRRNEFIEFSEKDLNYVEKIYYMSSLYIIYIMKGDLDKAKEVYDELPDYKNIKDMIYLVYPCITASEFFAICKRAMFSTDFYRGITLTAGRPFLLNGFGDFSRLGVFLPKNRDKAISLFAKLYGKENDSCLYEVCLAEYYYQQNKCYDASLLISRVLKSYDSKGDMRFLFVAHYYQLMLLIVNNQCPNISGYFNEMKEKLHRLGYREFMFNMGALEAWISSYNGNYECVLNWFNTDAPDEYGDFNMLDLFRYMVKIRCYLIFEKHIALVSLVEKLRPLLERGRRPKDLCLLDCLLAMSLHCQNKKEEAFDALERALRLSKKHCYDRTFADEGSRMFRLLLDYHNVRDGGDYVLKLISISRKMAIYYPFYLYAPYKNNKKFSEIEKDILMLLEQGKNNQEISECYLISVNTVKYHLKKIYAKLGVTSATHAVWHARLLGLLK